MEKKILVCLDGSKLSRAVCDYGIFLSKELDLPLVLLHVVEHTHTPSKLDLSGNLALGARDDLLEELVIEEMDESKKLIAKGRAVLKEFEVYAKEHGVQKCETLHRHGALEEILEELASSLQTAIIGLRGEDHNAIGSNVEELIRNLNTPILLVNGDFEPIQSVLIAYDGSTFATKALKAISKNPLLPHVKRFIANVNTDVASSAKLLLEAKKFFDEENLEVHTKSLQGDSIEALLSFAQEKDIDIIAMGAYSHNRLRSKIFGSFTTKMFLQATKPLLLFR
ncbi:MAG TPA: universal stress protein [Sulfurospirillum sp. UBA11407]|nr:MAG TPA: universal stress protein [Sulfurospirillum sp. UBA11407]